ncbi:methyltransferase domain-containing protein [Catenulispora sp. NF23]|uniref:class I SAM-dependent methyltransferase n=1 Tax=Catenulispora pinistramenti TaxID=2705254 RepID=UPI001BA5B2D8|nr:class I SAM-dependent methyltransferase [Catenulispora pinistramenti]MBS2538364.1 methyltransferase domain-containing protein [Catenulispora pinistramenti]
MTTRPETPQNTYTHGHHETVLRSHRWRTAENSAAYLLPRLSPGQSVLDVGCGPGTITADLADRVAGGTVTAVEITAEALKLAQDEAARRGTENVRFAVADVHALDFPDDSFDVVHAHQVLQHVADPVLALKEMRRVCKPGGVVAARDSDYGGFRWFPEVPALDEWLRLYQTLATSNGGHPDAGRRLRHWALAAGFAGDAIASSASSWVFAEEPDRRWWAEMWAERTTKSSTATQYVEKGFAYVDDLDTVAAGWRKWAGQDDGWFNVVHGEIVCVA